MLFRSKPNAPSPFTINTSNCLLPSHPISFSPVQSAAHFLIPLPSVAFSVPSLPAAHGGDRRYLLTSSLNPTKTLCLSLTPIRPPSSLPCVLAGQASFRRRMAASAANGMVFLFFKLFSPLQWRRSFTPHCCLRSPFSGELFDRRRSDVRWLKKRRRWPPSGLSSLGSTLSEFSSLISKIF